MTLAYDAGIHAPGEALPKLAATSSFYNAMRILPPHRREGVIAVYAFCRIVDDIADDWRAQRAPRMEALEAWRDQIDDLYREKPAPKLQWLAGPIQNWKLDQQNFHDVIDGMIMDVQSDIRAPSLTTLDLYCDRVASAVGRLTSPIFGIPLQAGIDLAHHLGRALQLTNILRDIDEDAAMGRIYLPQEMLRHACFPIQLDPAQIADLDLTLACEPLVQLTRQHFNAARTLMQQRPRTEVRAPVLMADIYEHMLDAMMARGFDAPRTTIRRNRLRLLLALLGSAIR